MPTFLLAILLNGSSAFAETYIHYSTDPVENKSHTIALKTEIEAERATSRWTHAKELLGHHYHKSVVKSGEKLASLDHLLPQFVQRALTKPYKKFAHSIAKTIIHESTLYGFDPIFLMAVIENESNFDPLAIGGVGEIGLMQITPTTGAWITKLYHLPWKGPNSLKNPITNIRIGSAYLAYLREEFNFEGQLYLAAYNMGSGNVRKALEKSIRPSIYSSKVMLRYLRFYSRIQNLVASTKGSGKTLDKTYIKTLYQQKDPKSKLDPKILRSTPATPPKK